MDCPICCEPYDGEGRYPMTICANGHSACARCVGGIRQRCPTCRMGLLQSPIKNRAMVEGILESQKITAPVDPVVPVAPAVIPTVAPAAVAPPLVVIPPVAMAPVSHSVIDVAETSNKLYYGFFDQDTIKQLKDIFIDPNVESISIYCWYRINLGVWGGVWRVKCHSYVHIGSTFTREIYLLKIVCNSYERYYECRTWEKTLNSDEIGHILELGNARDIDAGVYVCGPRSGVCKRRRSMPQDSMVAYDRRRVPTGTIVLRDGRYILEPPVVIARSLMMTGTFDGTNFHH
jgi:hypothetical protein